MIEPMGNVAFAKEHLVKAAALAKEAALESLWPTRCAVCDEPGTLLCDSCRASLPYIDWWRACTACGAPFGRTQCTECNPVMLKAAKRSEPPFAGATSALVYGTAARRIVSAYKDHGERRLAQTMADIMVPYVSPEWRATAHAITFVPATAAACRNRGFDHAELLAQQVAQRLDLPCIPAFSRPKSHDQRKLSRHERLENLENRISVIPGATPPRCLIVIDDVCTTGATLSAAASALQSAGTETVYALTFARTW